MDKKMTRIDQILEFNIVFPDEDYRSYLAVVNKINRKQLIKASTYLLNFGPEECSKMEHQDLFKKWFAAENRDFAVHSLNKIESYEKEKNCRTIIVNPMSSLYLFEAILYSDSVNDEIEDPGFNELLFKIYLSYNQLTTSNEHKVGESTQHLPVEDQMLGLILAQSIPSSDITNYNLVSSLQTQFLKSVYLFKFLSKLDQFKPLLSKFFNEFGLTDYRDYLTKLTPIVFSAFSSSKEGAIDIVIKDPDPNGIIHKFFDSMSIGSAEMDTEDRDFLRIRSAPLIKMDSDVYRVIFSLFVIENLFKSQYFRLKEINDQLGDKKIDDLRSFITYEFSEKQLLYSILQKAYVKRYKQFTGHEIEQANIKGGPDYYIRNGNYILIFESKDILLKADIKMSYDYGIMEAELKKKLYKSIDKKGKTENRAVLQLINFIRRIIEDDFILDKGLKVKNLHFYPVIVIHDRQLEAFGINRLICKWFLDEMENLNQLGYPTKRIRCPIVISIDTLIIFKDLIKENRLPLDEAIDKYHVFCNSKVDDKKFTSKSDRDSAIMDRYMPFDTFIFRNFNAPFPTDFKEEGLDLIQHLQ